MLSRIPHRQSLSLLLLLSIVLACGDDTEDPSPGSDPDASPPTGVEVPLGAALPPLAFALTVDYATPELLAFAPETIEGHLVLEVDASGVVSGTMSARAEDDVDLTAIEGRVQGTTISLHAENLDVAPGGWLETVEMSLSLLDDDGDGAPDGARGEAEGGWSAAIGDVVASSSYSSTLSASLDRAGSSPALALPPRRAALLPDGSLAVHFEEALREDDVREALRVLADGEPIPGTTSFAATAGLVARAAFQPDDFLPFGAVVTVELAGLEDLAGNPIGPPTNSLTVVADPGAAELNTGFESGLSGWIAVGSIRSEGAFEGVDPVEGSAQALLEQGSMLGALLDVPGDATGLDLSMSVLVDSSFLEGGIAAIALHAAGGDSAVVYENEGLGELPPCVSCTEYDALVGPIQPAIDLVPYQGRRVLLTIALSPQWLSGPVAALVDDIQIR